MIELETPNREDREILTNEIPLLVQDLGYTSLSLPRQGRRLWMGSFIRTESEIYRYPRFHMLVQVRYDYDLGRLGLHLDVYRHSSGKDSDKYVKRMFKANLVNNS